MRDFSFTGAHICTWEAGWEEGKNPAPESASEITDIRKVLSALSAVHVFIHVSMRLSMLISGTECVVTLRALYMHCTGVGGAVTSSLS